MIVIQEGSLTFEFPMSWCVQKYDDTTHYKSHVQHLAQSKAVDIVALSPEPNREVWLIEVKDYRANPRSKGTEIYDEIQQKVRDTLAGLFLAQRRPEAANLHDLVRLVSCDVKVRVAFHIEQPRVVSKLNPAVTDRANHRMKLRIALRSVDSKAEMCEIASMPPSIGWNVISA